MRLKEEFELPVAPADAWSLLSAIDKIAPFIPGAHLSEVQGHEYRGAFRVGVGPIDADLRGKVRFVERDGLSHTARLAAEAKEIHGHGHTTAVIDVSIARAEAGSKVSLTMQVCLYGALSLLRRDALAGAGAKVVRQFSEDLERDILSRQAPPRSSGPGEDEPAQPAGLAAAGGSASAGEPGEDAASSAEEGAQGGGPRSASAGGAEEAAEEAPSEGAASGDLEAESGDGLEAEGRASIAAPGEPGGADAFPGEGAQAQESAAEDASEEQAAMGKGEEPAGAPPAGTSAPGHGDGPAANGSGSMQAGAGSGGAEELRPAASSSQPAGTASHHPQDHAPELVEVHAGDDVRKWLSVAGVLAGAGVAGWFLTKWLRRSK